MRWIIILGLWSLETFAESSNRPCFIISGDKKDRNQAFDTDLYTKQISRIGNHICHKVDGWKEAMEMVNDPSFPKGGDLLIIQGAHGRKGGTFSCNSGDVTAEEALGYLNTLSSRYHVGAVFDTCFSGEMMRRKLEQDQVNPSNLDKLCLMTSMFNRMSQKDEKDFGSVLSSAEADQTLEDVFLKSYSGLISSAPWTEVGVSDFFIQHNLNRNVESGLKVLQNMNKITQVGACDTLGEANMAICASPSVPDEFYKLLLQFSEEYVPDELLNKFKTSMEVKLIELNLTRDEAGKKCYEGLLKFYHDKFNIFNLSKLSELEVVEKELSPNIRLSCEVYKKKLPAEEQASLYYSDLYPRFKKYRSSKARLSQIFSKQNFNNFSVMSFAAAASQDKRVCTPSDKDSIVLSALGLDPFEEEYLEYQQGDQNLENPTEMIYNQVSSQAAMKAFQNAALKQHQPKNEIDQARARACKEFKL